MAKLSDLPLKYRLFMTAYPYRRVRPCPWSEPRRPVGKARVALVTTAAFSLPEQAPFDESIRGGDPSWRALPTDGPFPPEGLVMGHRSRAFDPSGIERDPDLALPVNRLRELVAEGKVGELHHEALSFMGGITAPGRLVRETAPEAARRLASRGVDIALLTPV